MAMKIGAEPSKVSRASLSDLRQALLELVVELQGLDLRSHEALDLDDQVRRVVPLASSLLTRGDQLVAQVLASWDAAAWLGTLEELSQAQGAARS